MDTKEKLEQRDALRADILASVLSLGDMLNEALKKAYAEVPGLMLKLQLLAELESETGRPDQGNGNGQAFCDTAKK